MDASCNAFLKLAISVEDEKLGKLRLEWIPAVGQMIGASWKSIKYPENEK